MNRFIIIAIMSILHLSVIKASEQDSVTLHRNYTLIYKDIIKNSGFAQSFGIPIKAESSSSNDEILFEATIGTIVDLYNNRNKENDLLKRLIVSLKTEITIRSYEVRSRPIFSPNFIVSLDPEYIFLKTPKNVMWATIAMSHFSNGQSGDFFTDTSQTQINYRTATFSTYYYKTQLSWIRYFTNSLHFLNQAQFYQSYYFRHDYYFDETYPYAHKPMHNSYGNYRLGADFQFSSKVYSLSKNKKHKNIQYILRLENCYIFGNMSNYTNNINPTRFNLKTKTIVKFPEWIPISIFFQYYQGRDYYNIRYTETTKLLMGGIIWR